MSEPELPFDRILSKDELQRTLQAIYEAPPIIEHDDEYYRNSLGFYGLTELAEYIPRLEAIVKYGYGEDLVFANSYARIYQNTSYLGVHLDRAELDVTVSICLRKDTVAPWPLNVSKVLWEGEWKKEVGHTPWLADYEAYDLQPGQMAICEGKKYPHWRDTLKCSNNDKNIYAFFHWTRRSVPKITAKTNQVWVGDRLVKILMTMQHPKLTVLGGFLSDEECDALVMAARPRMVRSTTMADDGSDTHTINEVRTSQGMFFTRGETELCDRIEKRIATLVGWPLVNGEGMQVLHYAPGAEYKPHNDYFDTKLPGTVAVLKRGGQRVGTVVMYLNTPEQGGGTVFPNVGVEVAPIKGNAVFFSYAKDDETSLSLHGGAPVIVGEKWGATKWLRTSEFI